MEGPFQVKGVGVEGPCQVKGVEVVVQASLGEVEGEEEVLEEHHMQLQAGEVVVEELQQIPCQEEGVQVGEVVEVLVAAGPLFFVPLVKLPLLRPSSPSSSSPPAPLQARSAHLCLSF